MRRALIVCLAATLAVLGLADGTSAQTVPNQTFCQSRVDLEQAFLHQRLNTLGTLATVLQSSAPAPIKDAADSFAASISQRGASAFTSARNRSGKIGVDAFVASNCGFRLAPVVAVDGALQGVPATFDVGTVAIQFVNASPSRDHELIVVKLPSGVKMAPRKLLALPHKSFTDLGDVTGLAIAKPQATDVTIMKLTPGRYLAFDDLTAGKHGPRNWKQGMYVEFTVRSPNS